MAKPKTSVSHPLRADFVEVPARGRLGMTFAPGKVQPQAASGPWDRDLAADLQRLQAVYGADVLVSVIEAHELRTLRIGGLATAAGDRGMQWLHVPVVDAGTPTDEASWTAALRAVRARLERGETVVVHCKGGLGRTGTFAASVLVTYGIDPKTATARVREARAKTIENPAQESFVEGMTARWRTSEIARVRGCLLGGAVGDALGAPVEFQSLAQIRASHGDEGVRELGTAFGTAGAITDDTQMTLFTAEGLLRAHRRFVDKGICHPPSVVEHAYFRWLWTQGDRVPDELAWVADGWIFDDRRLHSPRAPGNTCVSALRQRVRTRVEQAELPEPLNDSKGCGGVMRVAPIGLVADAPWDLAKECAALTHAHPAGYLRDVVERIADDLARLRLYDEVSGRDYPGH